MNIKTSLTLLAAVLAFAAVPAVAQSEPPITIVVPYSAGGTADVVPRLLAPKLQSLLGVPVVVVNKPGAAGNLGADFVAHAPADGRTLLVVAPHFFVSDMLYKVKFAPRAFVPISIMAGYPNVLLVGAKHSALDLTTFIAKAKSSSEPLAGGSPGTGTSQHLSAEMLRIMAGLSYSHVPYKGSSAVLTDLASGQIDFAFDNLLAAQPMIKAGRVKVLAVGSQARSKHLPEVPAIREVLTDFESVTWIGVVAPPGTPRAVAERLSNAFKQAAWSPEINRRISDMQADTIGSSPQEMAETVRRDSDRWTKVIRAAKVVVE